jgi:zinc D-Ala-D-Ala carboxypeptidase
MDREFLFMLDQARHLCKIKFKIVKGYVSPDGQTRKNELNRSSHLIGRACEIFCQNSYKRYRIITALLEVGFTRIGFADDRIYVDNDDLKPDAIWHYRVTNKKFYINPI